MKWNWGTGIIISFGVFIVFILAMVFIMNNHPEKLASNTAYEDGLSYQKEIDVRSSSLPLSHQILITRIGTDLQIQFPNSESMHFQKITGTVTLFRPAADQPDVTFPLSLTANGKQLISTKSIASGHWRSIIKWEIDGKQFINEQAIVI